MIAVISHMGRMKREADCLPCFISPCTLSSHKLFSLLSELPERGRQFFLFFSWFVERYLTVTCLQKMIHHPKKSV